MAPATTNHLTILQWPIEVARWIGVCALSFGVSNNKGCGALLINARTTSTKPWAIAKWRYLEKKCYSRLTILTKFVLEIPWSC